MACGEDPAYGERCRDLAAELAVTVDGVAAEHGACSADTDCPWVAASAGRSRNGPALPEG